MIADITHGHVDAADVAFLVGLVLAVLAGLLTLTPRWQEHAGRQLLGWLAVGAICLGLLLL